MSPASGQKNGTPKPLPRHVAIIMDGNGRWARARNLPREEGHRRGVENVRKIVDCAREMDLRYLTLYAFSVENWHRPASEVGALMRLLEQFLKAESRNIIQKEIRFQVLGRVEDMPARIVKLLRETTEATREFSRWTLSLALNYGSRTEVLDAVQEYAMDQEAGKRAPGMLDWETFRQYLYTGAMPDPDLVIRTSGEYRISNFLLLQSAYAEYVFSEKYWPDFGPVAFREAIETFQRRERRFGRTGEQIQTTQA